MSEFLPPPHFVLMADCIYYEQVFYCSSLLKLPVRHDLFSADIFLILCHHILPHSQLFHLWRPWSCSLDQRPVLFAAMSSALRASTQKWKSSFLRLESNHNHISLHCLSSLAYSLWSVVLSFSCCRKTSTVWRSLQTNKTHSLEVQTSTSCTSEKSSEFVWSENVIVKKNIYSL